MVVLGQAGFSASEAIEAIGAVADLSTGTLVDMAVAADLLTTIIRAFGKEAFQASEISDIMANAINRSKLTIDKLRIAFNYVGPSADATGTSLEEVSAAMMALANSGLRASTIGTGLRQIFSRLVAPSAKLREKMEANGIAIEDLNIRVHGFAGVLENLKDMFYDVEKGTMDARKGFELFGLRGANAILALIKAVESGNYDQYLKYVYEVGTSAAMAATQIEGLALKFKNLTDRAKLLAVELGENGVAGVIGMVLDGMKGLVNAVTSFVKSPAGKLITALLLIKGAMYLVVTAGALLTSLFKWLVRFFGSKAGAILGGFWGRLAFAVFGAIAALDQFFKTSKELRAELADERVGLIKTADQIEFYQKALKNAREEMEKSSDSAYKYDSVVERLKKSFPELAEAIEAVKDNAELLDQLLEKRKIDDLSEAVLKLIGEYEALNKTIESQKLRSGFVEGINQEIEAMKKRGEEADKQSKKDYPSTYKAQEWVMKKLEQAGDRIVNAWEGIKEKFGLATEGMRELGAETEKVKKMTPELALVLEMVSSTLARKYKDQALSLAEIRKAVIETLEATKFQWGAIEQVADQTIEKVQDLRRIAEMPFRMGDVDTVFKTMWDNATAAQKVGLKQRQKQLDTELASYKKFADTHKKMVKDKEAVIANIVLKAHLEMLDLFDDEEIAEWAHYAERIEMVKQLAELQITYIEKIAGEEQKALADKIKRAKGNEDRIGALKEKADRLEKLRIDQITAYKEQSELMITRFQKEQNRLRNEYEVEEAAKTADRVLAAYDRKQEEAVLLGKKRAERAQVETAEMEYDIAVKKYNNLVSLLEEYYIHYELYANKRLELDAKIAEAEEAMENARIALLRASTREHEMLLKKQLTRLEGYYRAGWISAKEYYDKIKEAEEAGLFKDDPKELERLKVLLEGSAWDNFVHGARRASQELKTFNEVAMEIGENFAGVFADNVIDAFDAIVDGSETAAEAFSKFAADTLKWIARLIMQMMIMRAVSGMFGGGMGMSSMGGGGMASYGVTSLKGHHKGGHVGTEGEPVSITKHLVSMIPRFHSGLGADEMLSVLKKNEFVFTPKQMEALQGMGGMSISVPVTVSSGDTMLASRLRTNIEDTVRRTMREEMR